MDQFGLFGEPEELEEPQDISPDDVFSNASDDFLEDDDSILLEADLIEEEVNVVEISSKEEAVVVSVPEIESSPAKPEPDPVLLVEPVVESAVAVAEIPSVSLSNAEMPMPKEPIMDVQVSRTIADKIIDVKAEILKATQGGDIDIAKLESLIARIKELESIASKKAALIERIEVCEDQEMIASLLELFEGRKVAPKAIVSVSKGQGRTRFDLKAAHDVNGLLSKMKKGTQYKISDLLDAVGIVRGMDLNGAASFDAYVLKYKSDVLKPSIRSSMIYSKGEKAQTVYFVV